MVRLLSVTVSTMINQTLNRKWCNGSTPAFGLEVLRYRKLTEGAMALFNMRTEVEVRLLLS